MALLCSRRRRNRNVLILFAACLTCAAFPTLAAQPTGSPITSARYTIEGGEQFASVTAQFELKVTGDGARAVPLLPSSLALESFKVKGGDARLEKGPKHYVVRVSGAGTYTAALEFLLPVKKRGREYTAHMPLALSAASTVQFRVDKADHIVRTSPEVPLEVAGDKAALRATLYPAGIEGFELSWLPAEFERKFAAVFEADEQSTVSLSPGAAVSYTSLGIKVRRGELDELMIVVPPGVDVMQVLSRDVKLRKWRVEEKTRQLRVQFAAPVKGKASLYLTTEQTTKTTDDPFRILPFRVLGATRQTGRLVLAAFPRFRIVDAGSTAVRQAVKKEPIIRRSPYPVPLKQLGYQYYKPTDEVRVELTTVPSEITATTAGFVRLQAGLVEMFSRIDYVVRNAAVRDLRIALDEGLVVLEVVGKDIETWGVKDGVLRVRLKRPVLGRYALALKCVQHLRKVDGVLVPQVHCPDAERETGAVGVSAGDEVALTHHHSTRFQQVNAAALPKWLQALKPKLAYTYEQPGGVLAVSTSLIQPAVEVEGYAVAKVAEDSVDEEYIFTATVERQPVFNFLLRLPEGLTPINLVGDEVADWEFLPSQGIITVSLKRARLGAMRMHLFCERRLEEMPEQVPLGGVTVLGTDHTTGWFAVGTEANLSLLPPAQDPAGMVSADVREVPSLLKAYGALHLAYRWTGEQWGLPCRTRPVEPVIRAATNTGLLFGTGSVRVQTDINWHIDKASVGEFLLELPAGALGAVASGANIRDREQTGDLLRVRLADPVKGTYDLRVVYELLVDAQKGALDYGGVVLPQAGQQNGVVGVYLEDRKIEVVVGKMSGSARRTGATDLGLNGAAFLGAFEYTDPARSIEFTLKGHAMAKEVQLQALSCNISTVVKRDGQTVTYMNCQVSNAGAQFFRLRFPEGADLWGTYVEQEVKPTGQVKETEQQEQIRRPKVYKMQPVRPHEVDGDVLLPLLDAPPHRPFKVALIWSQPADKLGFASSLALVAPDLDLPTEQVDWDVYLPEEYEIVSAGGNMEMLRRDVWYEQGLPGVAWKHGRAAWPYVVKALIYTGIGLGVAIAAVLLSFAVRAIARAAKARARQGTPWPKASKPAPQFSLLTAVFLMALVAIVVIASLSTLGGKATNTMTLVSNSLPGDYDYGEAQPTASRPPGIPAGGDYAGETYDEARERGGRRRPVDIANISILGLESPKGQSMEGEIDENRLAERQSDNRPQRATQGEQWFAEQDKAQKKEAERDRYGRALEIAEAYRKRGDLDKARDNLKYALKQRPDSAAAKEGLKRLEEMQVVSKTRRLAQEKPKAAEPRPAPPADVADDLVGKLLTKDGQAQPGRPAAGPAPEGGEGGGGAGEAREDEKKAKAPVVGYYATGSLETYTEKLNEKGDKGWWGDVARSSREHEVLDIVSGKRDNVALDNNGKITRKGDKLVILGTPEQIKEVEDAAGRLHRQMAQQLKNVRRGEQIRAEQDKSRFRAEIRNKELAEQLKAASAVGGGTVAGSRGAGAKPLAISIPAAGTRAYPFRMDYAGTSRARVELVCLRSGTSIVLQAALGLAVLLVAASVSWRKVSVGAPLAVLAALVLIFLLTTGGQASKPYFVTALAGLILAAPVAVTSLVISLRASRARAERAVS